MKKYFKWELIKKILDILQFIVVVFGVIFTVIQIKEISNNQFNRKNDLAIRYYDKLNSGVNRDIFITIEHKKSILVPNGKFTTDQLDDYINDFHSVGQSLNNNLLDKNKVCSDFYDLTYKAHNNIEIENYIIKVREEEKDDTYFMDFDTLYNFILDC